MSWQRNLAIVLLPLLLAACGFEPLYGQKDASSNSKLKAGVKIDPIGGKLGLTFKSKLEDTLNPSGGMPATPSYRLVVKLEHLAVPISVARDGTVSRYNVTFSSEYVLYRTADDKPVTSGQIGYLTSYNNLTNVYFSTYVSEQDALKRGTIALAELYRARLATYLDEGAPQAEVIHMPSKKPSLDPNNILRQEQGTTINMQ